MCDYALKNLPSEAGVPQGEGVNSEMFYITTFCKGVGETSRYWPYRPIGEHILNVTGMAMATITNGGLTKFPTYRNLQTLDEQPDSAP